MVLLIVLVAGLIVYKTGPALRAIRAAQSTGVLKLHPYIVSTTAGTTPVLLWTESLAYVRIIWPALVFGILVAAAARMAIPQDWFALTLGGSALRATFSAAAAGMPLMLCSCCAAPVFEGVYGRTRRLDASLALMLAAPGLNPAALALTFILFPLSVATGRLALTIAALVGVAGIGAVIVAPMRKTLEQNRSQREQQSLPVAYIDSVLHVALRTVPLILIGIPIAILMFDQLCGVPSFGASSSVGMLILFIAAILLLPMPTLFEIPLAYTLLTVGAPLGIVTAVLFVGPTANLPSLMVVGRTAGIKASLLLAVLLGGVAVAAALAFPR